MSVSPVGAPIPLLDTRALLEPMVNAQLEMTDKLLSMDAAAESAQAQSAAAISSGTTGGLDVYA